MTTTPASQPLRDLVEQRINQRWTDFAQAHPNLARAIDQARLIDTAVQNLRADPAFTESLRAADLDEAKLAAVAGLLGQVERWIGLLLPL